MADPTIILDIEPDWSSDPAISYSFNTVVQAATYFAEQRRPLLQNVVRSANYSFTEKDEKSQRLLDNLLASKGERLVMPIFTEPILITSAVVGGVVIVASTTLTYLWNIHNCGYVVLIDTTTGESEMKKIASVSGQNIVLMTVLLGTWTAATTIVYPAIAAALNSTKPTLVTDGVGSVEAEFVETVLGEYATQAWVGLEDRICCEQGEIGVILICSEYFAGINTAPLAETDAFSYGIITGESAVIFTAWGPDPNPTLAYFFGPCEQTLSARFAFLGSFDFYFRFELVSLSESLDSVITLELLSGGVNQPSLAVTFTWGVIGGTFGIQGNSVENIGFYPQIRLRRDSSNNIYAYNYNDMVGGDAVWEWDGDADGILVGNLSGQVQPRIRVKHNDAVFETAFWEFVTTAGCDNAELP